MKCPHCTDATLVMAERQGVEIDYCPTCRGIWLDRGELDKLLERAADAPSLRPAVHSGPTRHTPDYDGSAYRNGKDYKRHRKSSWLHELFD